MTRNDIISKIREQMTENNINTYIVLKFDPHKSEYSPAHYNYINFVSGFTGSTATLTITQDEVCLFVDGRYHIQASTEVEGSDVKVMKLGVDKVPTMYEYIKKITKDGDIIAFDGNTMPYSVFDVINKSITSENITFKGDLNLIDDMWENRPALMNNKIYEHTIEFTGLSYEEKLSSVKEKMAEDKADVTIISTLEDIAWLLNLRGNDLLNSPTFRSYVVIDKDNTHLFVDDTRFENVTLAQDIILHKYEEVNAFVSSLSENLKFVVKSDLNYSLFNCIKSSNIKKIPHNYTEVLKAVKSDIELKNMENAYLKDCVALVRAIKYIKENCTTLTEVDVDDILFKERSKEKDFLFPSFDTIAGYMANGALMHYSATKEKHSKLGKKGFLLIDSGGHYLDGTTDITRTIVLGDITDEMKKDFTFVLRSMAKLTRATFLKGATGTQLDMYARMSMWDNLMDFKSGTGHGIGFCLNVHEGPNGISQKATAVAEINNVYTNEPGVYKEGKYGIRTENTIVVKSLCENNDGIFYHFKTLNFIPIDLDAVDKKYLSKEDIDWLNDYHKETYNKLSPYLNDEEKTWLKHETRQI